MSNHNFFLNFTQLNVWQNWPWFDFNENLSCQTISNNDDKAEYGADAGFQSADYKSNSPSELLKLKRITF